MKDITSFNLLEDLENKKKKKNLLDYYKKLKNKKLQEADRDVVLKMMHSSEEGIKNIGMNI